MSNAFYNLWWSRRLHCILVDNELASAIHALFTSQLDYNNVICVDMKPSAIRKFWFRMLQCSSSTQDAMSTSDLFFALYNGFP